MSIFDILFLVVVLSAAITLVAALIGLLRGRRRSALRALGILAACLAVYFLVDIVVTVSSPQRVLRMGQNRCFDEMCFAATSVKIVPTLGPKGRRVKAAGRFYLVTIRLSSHARRRPQRELGVMVSLIDSRGQIYGVSSAGRGAFEAASEPNPPITSLLQPGESLNSVQVFDVPKGASGIALHVGHSGPGLFIIGDDENPLHKPTLIRLRVSK
ncbi:MAG TPA: hypothetical protein VFW40_05870 [Capsulimonadaceae bacterium]|nr:hypothetical protein [Capsulimonadaceae bacterium]